MLLSSQLIRTRRISITTSSLILRTLLVTGSSKTSFFHRLLSNGSATDYVWNMAYQLSNQEHIETEKSARIIQDDLLTAMQSVKQLIGALRAPTEEPEAEEEPEEPVKKKSSGALVIVLILALGGAGGYFYFTKVK